MQKPDITGIQEYLSQNLSDLLIRLAITALLVVLCVKIFLPFMGLLLWALILAVTLYPMHKALSRKLKDKQGTTASIIVVLGILLIGVPTAMLVGSFADHFQSYHSTLKEGSVTIPQPAEGIADLPLIGDKVYKYWKLAADDPPTLVEQLKPQIEAFVKSMVSFAANTAGGIFQFIGSLIIAGIMMAYGRSGSQAMLRIFERFAGGQRGPSLHKLTTATIRSVAAGVIGVAVIQALLLGIGFIWADIPAAGVLALIVLLIGILQLPALIITLPVIGYLWWSGGDSSTMNVIYTIYLVVAGAADGFLKPLLLGRGVEAPMPIILLGALGGMVSSGIIGLFVGAVLLAVGYQIFMEWVDRDEAPDNEQAVQQE